MPARSIFLNRSPREASIYRWRSLIVPRLHPSVARRLASEALHLAPGPQAVGLVRSISWVTSGATPRAAEARSGSPRWERRPLLSARSIFLRHVRPQGQEDRRHSVDLRPPRSRAPTIFRCSLPPRRDNLASPPACLLRLRGRATRLGCRLRASNRQGCLRSAARRGFPQWVVMQVFLLRGARRRVFRRSAVVSLPSVQVASLRWAVISRPSEDSSRRSADRCLRSVARYPRWAAPTRA